MSRLSWHWQAGLDVAVDTAHHQLGHAVRVEMKLATARARPGHHMPRFRSLGWLAARRTASPAHRSPTSYKVRTMKARLSSVDRGARRRECHGCTAASCRHAAMHQRKGCRGLQASPRCIRRRIAAFFEFPLKKSLLRTFYSCKTACQSHTLACTVGPYIHRLLRVGTIS